MNSIDRSTGSSVGMEERKGVRSVRTCNRMEVLCRTQRKKKNLNKSGGHDGRKRFGGSN